jgi:hypothetical protein
MFVLIAFDMGGSYRPGRARRQHRPPGSVIATLPMLVIFFLGQRYFVEGIATTGHKG